jgi:glycerol uptake facilitator-like aquaporin
MSDTIYLRDIRKRPGFLTVWERHRHHKAHWFVELFAESLGVFLYCYAGVGSTAAYIIGTLSSQAGLGSVLQIGFGYAFGILLAITICAGTSGGHFNPCVTISLVVFRGFPPLKAVRYIAAQIFGAYIACLLVYTQYKDLIKLVDEGLAAKGLLDSIQFTPNGTGGILALYTQPGANLARTLLNEFVSDTVIGLAIWGCIDPTNFLVPPAAGPWVISFAYAVVIWGFAPPGLAANSARDIGGRLAALSIWGLKASGGNYAALAALTNIPAMLFAVVLYEFFLTDSSRVMPNAHMEYMIGHQKHQEQHGAPSHHILSGNGRKRASSTGSVTKEQAEHTENHNRA